MYDTILDADFLNVPVRLEEACAAPDDRLPIVPGSAAGLDPHGAPGAKSSVAPPEACRTLAALALSWEISLDPDSQVRDARFAQAVERAIADAAAWTERDGDRAESWFYLGAAYGARTQWRVLRQQRLAAARDGKRIKDSLEQALALDPDLHDANFGIGMYRCYADVAPTSLRMLRWLLLLPGGDRLDGLRQMLAAREHGRLVRGEADYQLHLIYLWYEHRPLDALALVHDLQARYPRNPLFQHIEAEIQDGYFHDPAASYAASARLLARARARLVHAPDLASVRARLNMATQLARLGDRAAAIDLLTTLVAERPARPHGSAARARRQLEELRTKN